MIARPIGYGKQVGASPTPTEEEYGQTPLATGYYL